MSASTDRKFAKFLAFGSAMFGCTWAQVLGIGICLLCLCLCLWLCVSVNVRMFVLNSQDNLRLLCEATMRGCSSSIRRCLRFAKLKAKKKAEKEHGMLCGIAWRRILQVSPQLVCAVRRCSQKGKHNNWLINALQVAAKTKLFSARGKTLINASLKSRQTTTRCKRLRVAAGAELFITSGQANTGEAAEGAAVEGELGEESQQTACSQSATKTFAITRGGAEPRPGSEDTGMDTGTAMDMDMEKVDMEQLDIAEEEARLSKGAAQQCQRRRRRRRQKSQRGQAVKNEL